MPMKRQEPLSESNSDNNGGCRALEIRILSYFRRRTRNKESLGYIVRTGADWTIIRHMCLLGELICQNTSGPPEIDPCLELEGGTKLSSERPRK